MRVNAIAEDFEHGQDHLVKIFTCVLLQGVSESAGEVSEGGLDEVPTVNEKGTCATQECGVV